MTNGEFGLGFVLEGYWTTCGKNGTQVGFAWLELIKIWNLHNLSSCVISISI